MPVEKHMLTLDLVPTYNHLNPEQLFGKTAVVFDVLRASSTIITALQNGCREIFVAPSYQEARRLAERSFSSPVVLLGGEKEGIKPRGFDFGNSPAEYQGSHVQGATLIFITTNGTNALRASSASSEIFVGGFLNISALAKHLMEKEEVMLVPAGKEGSPCLEDTLCAGALIQLLQGQSKLALSPEAGECKQLFEKHQHELTQAVLDSEHGRFLAGLGLQEDVKYCVQRGVADIIPTYYPEEGVVRG